MDARFILSPAGRCEITPLDAVPLVRVPLAEHDLMKTVKKRASVAAGMLLATHSSPNVGDLHAPVSGIIKDVTPNYIEIEVAALKAPAAAKTPEAARAAGQAEDGAAEKSGAPAAKAAAEIPVSPAPVSFDGLDQVQLGNTLKELGVSIRPFTRPCDLLIVNGLNPEPGMLYAQELFESYRPTLEAGFALLRRLSGATSYVLALPEGSPHALGGTTPHFVKPVYPISLARPLVLAVTGKEHSGSVNVVRLHALFNLGLVAESGLPLTRTVITALGKNYLVPIGTPLSAFLELAGQRSEPGDSVILGGAMRGSAISNTSRGIGKGDEALLLMRKGHMPPLEDNPCIGCGACVHVCPVRLRPNMLSRYAEFEQYEACHKELIEVCIECGLCGYVCPACRPMQQYFRMAKHHLGLSSRLHMAGR